MPLHIGIVACSVEGAALCYRTVAEEGARLMGRHSHPEVSLHTHPLSLYMEHIYENRWEGVAELMLSSAQKLAGIGADFFICPDNTIHQVFDHVAPRSPRPWLHIAEVVAAEAAHRRLQRLGILGTRYLMESVVYPSKLTPLGIDFRTPPAEERETINRIIFDDLVHGRFPPEALSYFQQVIEALKNRGCDGVVLGCTEIPLLVREEDSPLPTFDSTRLLAKAAVQYALEEQPKTTAAATGKDGRRKRKKTARR